MPINIKIEGNPESIRSAGRWLRSSLSAGVEDCITQVYRAHGDSESGWQGEAGNACRAKMSSGGKKADELAADSDRTGQSFEVYADDLQTAKAGMDRARQIALDAGLEVTDTQILDPGEGPTLLAGADGTVSPQVAQEFQAAQQAHQQKVTAYNAAAGEASRAQGILDGAKGNMRSFISDCWNKRYFIASDFVNSSVGALAAKQKSILLRQADFHLEQARRHEQHYLKAGDPKTRALNNRLAYDEFIKGEKLRSGTLAAGRRIGSKIPIVGLGITAAGIGYDIHSGKPPAKAIFSGLGSAGIAAGVGFAIGGPVGALVGVGVGVLAGYGLDKAYDALPEGVTNKIEEGTKAAGDALGDAAGFVSGGVKSAWDSLF